MPAVTCPSFHRVSAVASLNTQEQSESERTPADSHHQAACDLLDGHADVIKFGNASHAAVAMSSRPFAEFRSPMQKIASLTPS